MRWPATFLLFLALYHATAELTLDSEGWAIEKYVVNVATGTGAAVQRFFLEHRLCSPKTECKRTATTSLFMCHISLSMVIGASDLGCGALRSWCIVQTPYQSQEWPHTHNAELHFVEAPALNDLRDKHTNVSTVEQWIDATAALNANMTQFNPLMLNKLQLYAPPRLFQQVLTSFEASGVPTMRRSSRDAANKRPVAHLSFEYSGHVFEVVSEGGEFNWPAWDTSEYPLAHEGLVRLSSAS